MDLQIEILSIMAPNLDFILLVLLKYLHTLHSPAAIIFVSVMVSDFKLTEISIYNTLFSWPRMTCRAKVCCSTVQS